MLFFKALLSVLALPGIVIGLIPTILILNDPWRRTGHLVGYLLLLVGVIVLFLSIRAFYVAGKGTLAPWAPPKTIVRIGPYKYLRSPMYVGVLLCLVGMTISYGSPLLAAYLLVMASIFHINLVFIEEPLLAKKFGDEWQQYVIEVPRWLPRFKGLR